MAKGLPLWWALLVGVVGSTDSAIPVWLVIAALGRVCAAVQCKSSRAHPTPGVVHIG